MALSSRINPFFRFKSSQLAHHVMPLARLKIRNQFKSTDGDNTRQMAAHKYHPQTTLRFSLRTNKIPGSRTHLSKKNTCIRTRIKHSIKIDYIKWQQYQPPSYGHQQKYHFWHHFKIDTIVMWLIFGDNFFNIRLLLYTSCFDWEKCVLIYCVNMRIFSSPIYSFLTMASTNRKQKTRAFTHFNLIPKFCSDSIKDDDQGKTESISLCQLMTVFHTHRDMLSVFPRSISFMGYRHIRTRLLR